MCAYMSLKHKFSSTEAVAMQLFFISMPIEIFVQTQQSSADGGIPSFLRQ